MTKYTHLTGLTVNELWEANKTLCAYTRRHFVAQMPKFRCLAVEIRTGKRKNEDARERTVCVGPAHLIR